jgi:hypothetical protein
MVLVFERRRVFVNRIRYQGCKKSSLVPCFLKETRPSTRLKDEFV